MNEQSVEDYHYIARHGKSLVGWLCHWYIAFPCFMKCQDAGDGFTHIAILKPVKVNLVKAIVRPF